MKDNVCRIPVSATVEIIDGKAVMTSAVYANIPADIIARFLIEKFGIVPIFGGGERNAAE